MIHLNNLTINSPLNLSSSEWSILQNLWTQSQFSNSSLTFTSNEKGWLLQESISSVPSFSFRRDFINNRRYTDIDIYGLLGLSLLNISSTSCIITEGVSDFLTTKLNNPSLNVLGLTNLGGSLLARKILISLFTHITIISDTDRTGRLNSLSLHKFFSSHQINTSIYYPQRKDITEDFLFSLKLSYNEI